MENEIKELMKVGLTGGEAKVYLALLDLKSSTVGPIVKRSRVSYSNVYDILHRLIEKGIVSYILRKKTKYFRALKPSHLKNYLNGKEKRIREQKLELDKISKMLEKREDFESEQSAEIFIGTKGLKSAYDKLYLSNKGEEFLYLFSYEDRYAEKMDLFYFSTVGFWKNTKMRGIANKGFRKSPYYKRYKKLVGARFVDFPIPANIDIGKEKIMIVSWEKPIVAILIHSKSVASSFRRYFDSLWQASGD